jgi:hypothetical protein
VKKFYAGDSSSASTIQHNSGFRDNLTLDLHSVNEASKSHDCRAMLVIMENGYWHEFD